MSQLFVLVVQDPDLESDILSAWLEVGIPGVTVMDSHGLSHGAIGSQFDQLPPMAGLSSILRAQHVSSLTLWSILPDEFDVDGLIAVTESVVGDLNQPHVGVAFAMPIQRTWGLRKS